MEKLQKQLIQEFIKKIPGRPFEEVVRYAKELGADEKILKEAILQLSNLEKELDDERVTLKKEKKKAVDVKKQKSKDLIPLSEVESVTFKNRKSFLRLLRAGTLKRKAIIVSTSFIILVVVILSNQSKIAPLFNRIGQILGEKSSSSAIVASPNNSADSRFITASQMSIDPKKVFTAPSSSVTLAFTGEIEKEIFGFFPYWMLDAYDKVNLEGLTTVALFGLSVDGEGNVITGKTDDTFDGGWTMWFDKRLDDLIERLKKKNVKVVLVMKSFNSKHIEDLITNESSQRTFIANTIQLINSKRLDGVNIDFEHTGTASSELRFAFTRFVANVHAELDRQLPDAHLSVDCYLKSGNEEDIYNVSLLSDYVDSIFVMGYDVHSPNTDPGAVAPLEGEKGVVEYMEGYLKKVDPKKIILGVPFYGYDWPIKESTDSASYKDDGIVKMLSYAEIASSSAQYEISWNETTQTPYFQYVDQRDKKLREVHFDNSRSLAAKFDYINKKNLQGVGIWALGYEGLAQEFQSLLFEKFAR